MQHVTFYFYLKTDIFGNDKHVLKRACFLEGAGVEGGGMGDRDGEDM